MVSQFGASYLRWRSGIALGSRALFRSSDIRAKALNERMKTGYSERILGRGGLAWATGIVLSR